MITALAKKTVIELYSEGHEFLKAGIGLIELVDKKYQQFDLWQQGQSSTDDKAMRVMDKVNHLKGNGTLFLAAQGVSKPWYMRQQFTSPQYTTKWQDIPVVHC